ncbi:MAG TPA: M56 family metallopeptidase [Candidatus Sulfotelmatobacter sp.]
MFAARGIAVSCSVFFLVYVILSLGVGYLTRHIVGRLHETAPRRLADLLFALRMFPLTAAALITAAFTVPSFLLLEPRAIVEPVGGAMLALGICGLLLAALGAANAVRALLRASRMVERWTYGAKLLPSQAAVSVLVIPDTAPALTAAGIVRSKVLLSGAAQAALDANELQIALRHEEAHVRRRDNFKKLLLRIVAFPGMAGLEISWVEATEMAADDAAVCSVCEALDLASALIKLSQIDAKPERHSEELMTAFAQSSSALINARVQRLVSWGDHRLKSTQRYSVWYAGGAALAIATAFCATYSHLLAQVHTATEWLVK